MLQQLFLLWLDMHSMQSEKALLAEGHGEGVRDPSIQPQLEGVCVKFVSRQMRAIVTEILWLHKHMQHMHAKQLLGVIVLIIEP